MRREALQGIRYSRNSAPLPTTFEDNPSLQKPIGASARHDDRRGQTGIGEMSDILIIEDDDLMRALLEEWLGEAGYPVRARAPRETAGADAAELVIVGVCMPRQAGTELVRAVRDAHPGASLIAISGQFRPGLAGACAAARALGVQQVIAKPFTREALLDAVRAAVGRPR
jgi:DNA-binding NtrC family response regulator